MTLIAQHCRMEARVSFVLHTEGIDCIAKGSILCYAVPVQMWMFWGLFGIAVRKWNLWEIGRPGMEIYEWSCIPWRSSLILVASAADSTSLDLSFNDLVFLQVKIYLQLNAKFPCLATINTPPSILKLELAKWSEQDLRTNAIIWDRSLQGM